MRPHQSCPPISSPTPPSEKALLEAAQWCVTFADEDVSPDQRRDFERWLQRDDEHGRAWEAMRSTWSAFSSAEQPGLGKTLEYTFQQERVHRRRLLGKAGGLAILLLSLIPAGWWASGTPAPHYLLADHHTAVGERNTVVLEDGSELTLDTDSAVDIAFSQKRRSIELLKGRVFVEVAPDSQRPLEVVTPEGSVRALGTAFSVQRLRQAGAPSMRVAVYESRVDVCPRDTACQEVDSGHGGEVSHGIYSPQALDLTQQPAWTAGTMVLDNRPLNEALDALARYHPGVLRYDAAELAPLRVSGVLPLDDMDKALDVLARALPIETQRFTPWLISVNRKKE
ncbi:DUF4880 domain-containing protein [Halomonas alkaliantarctica]|nr:DUF4880 domain-containing protein [Halomonas alkaliantarctica]